MSPAPPLPPRAERARTALARLLAGAEGLVGVGIGARPGGGVELLVLVESDGCAAGRRAPAEHQGLPVRVEVAGKPRRQPA